MIYRQKGMLNLPQKNELFVDITIDANAKSTKELTGGKAGNKPEKEEVFSDFGFGMFIHVGLDVLINSVISHWVIGADEKLVEKFYNEYPSLFRFAHFDPERWATIAKMAGAKYAVLTAKHHSGFCLWDTKTTDCNVMKTPFGRDIVTEFCDAFKRFGVEPGIYFSPYDFYYQFMMAKRTVQFATPDMLPENDEAFMAYNQAQVAEIMKNYPDLFCFFFDGPPEGLKELVWKYQPNCLVTRGEMKTPENVLPEDGLSGSWEACYTMANGWSYKPVDPAYSTAPNLIRLLIEIRSRGGNLLLNVTPDMHGDIPFEQERIMQEIGIFLFFNGEAIYNVRPFNVPHENNKKVWYTKAKDSDTVYAFMMTEWPYAVQCRQEFTLHSVEATEKTAIEMVGQNGKVVEHYPEIDAKTHFKQDDAGLHINAVRSYRPYDNRTWPYPVVFRITHAKYRPQD